MKSCALILSHGRPRNVKTIGTLRRCGYTGEIAILLDDEDGTAQQYRETYPDCRFFVFSKREEMRRPFASVDNFNVHGTVLYARNAAWKIMEGNGYTHFVMLDDDYTHFNFRWVCGSKLKGQVCKKLDNAFSAIFDWLDTSRAQVVALAQGGDFIGGADGSIKKPLFRKAMNVYFFRTDRKYLFTGAMNDDVNTYLLANQHGRMVFTLTFLSIMQEVTQSNKGGLTEMYLDNGTYRKSFFSVMVAPSCTKVSYVGGSGNGHTHYRLHHIIDWAHCAPKIISGRWRKE